MQTMYYSCICVRREEEDEINRSDSRDGYRNILSLPVRLYDNFPMQQLQFTDMFPLPDGHDHDDEDDEEIWMRPRTN